MEKQKLLTVEQLHNFAREHNMEHARLRFRDTCYYDVVDAEISSSVLYPDQQFIILS